MTYPSPSVTPALASLLSVLGTGATAATHMFLKGHAAPPHCTPSHIAVTGRFSPLPSLAQNSAGRLRERGAGKDKVGAFNISDLISVSGSIYAQHRSLRSSFPSCCATPSLWITLHLASPLLQISHPSSGPSLMKMCSHSGHSNFLLSPHAAH